METPSISLLYLPKLCSASNLSVTAQNAVAIRATWTQNAFYEALKIFIYALLRCPFVVVLKASSLPDHNLTLVYVRVCVSLSVGQWLAQRPVLCTTYFMSIAQLHVPNVEYLPLPLFLWSQSTRPLYYYRQRSAFSTIFIGGLYPTLTLCPV